MLHGMPQASCLEPFLFVAQRDSQNDTIRRLMRDVEFASGAEERLESELIVSIKSCACER